MKPIHSFVNRNHTDGGGSGGAPAGGAPAGGAPAGGAPAGGDGGAADAVARALAAGAAPAGGAPAGGAPVKPFYDGLYDTASGKIDKTALDRLPDVLKPHKDWLAKYDTIEAALLGGANAHSMAVKKALTPLPADAPADAIAERKAHLDAINGVPKGDKPEILTKAYGIERPNDLPEMFWNQEGAGRFAMIAQKNSLSPGAVKELLGLQLELTKDEISRGQAMETEYYTKQDQDFAVASQRQGMDLTKATDLAIRGAKGLGLDPGSPIFKNAGVRLAMIRAHQLISEEKLITGDPTAAEQPGNELAQARDIMQNPANPLHAAWKDPNDPRHESAKDRVNALYQTHGERQVKKGGL